MTCAGTGARATPAAPGRRASAAAVLACAALAVAGCSSSEGPSCGPGLTACGSSCFDLQSHPGHCGACNRTCIPGASCVDGACGCPAGLTACGGTCVDLQTSARDCGACGRDCGLGTCGGGACTCSADPPTVTSCDGTCVDTARDIGHCGGCDTACRAGWVCEASACQCKNQLCDPGTAAEACVDTSRDPANCGACGRACLPGQLCQASACACPAGLTPCPAPPAAPAACVDARTDPANCGACGIRCPSGQPCVAGACAPACTGPTCGTLCCPGDACCGGGTACQSQHDNGAGQRFYDCAPAGAYSLDLARKAAEPWSPPGKEVSSLFPCGGTYCLARQTPIAGTAPASCGVWCYDGLLEGRVLVNDLGYACICPDQALGSDWY